jgi:putative transposase
MVRESKCRTTFADNSAEHSLDHVKRQFQESRPNQLWVADFAYVAKWAGFVFVACAINLFARRIIGWRMARSMRAELVLDAMEQALWLRSRVQGVIHHSDRGSQYLSIRYSERLSGAGTQPSVGSVGDSYDNAMAESIIGLYKAEVIHHRGPWRHLETVEYAALEWVDWFNHRRLLDPIGNVPSAAFEASYYHSMGQLPMAAQLKLGALRKSRGGSHRSLRLVGPEPRFGNVMIYGKTIIDRVMGCG